MNNIYDLLIIGGGPAGLTCAIYGLRNGLRVGVIEKFVFGGQITNSPKVLNIPGFNSISGDEYGDLLFKQVDDLGGDLIFDECIKVHLGKIICLDLKDGSSLYTKSLVLATGSKHRVLNVKNEDELIGKKVHFCAVCDASLYKNKTVVLIGGGNSALVEADLLANVVKKLIILQDLSTFSGEASLVAQLKKHDNIETFFNVKDINYVLEDDTFKGVSFFQGGKKEISCDGVFLAIGLVPDNKYFTDLVAMDEKGYFISDESGRTKYDNIFVAGDCRQKKLRQVVTACSDGANCAISANEYIRSLNGFN